MSAQPAYPTAPAVLGTQHAAQRLWRIRHLLREGALDLRAADTALYPLGLHPNARIAGLAEQTREQVIVQHLTASRGVA